MLARLSQRKSAPGGARGLLLPLLLTMMMMVTKAASVDEVESEESQEILEDEEAISGELQELTSSESGRVSPHSSWLIFRRNSNRGDNRRSKGPRRTSKHGLPGPPGPPGPQGPPGPPAALLPQQQELIQELKVKLKDMAAGVHLPCDRPPRVSTSFFSRLLQSITIPRRSLLELQPFSKPSDSEQSLQRGRTFNSSTGRYTAPVSGFYQLTASLLIESGDRVQVRLRDSVKAAICIESLCQSNLSVESVMGVAAGGGTFSMLLTGTLYLQVGQHQSVALHQNTEQHSQAFTGSNATPLTDYVTGGRTTLRILHKKMDDVQSPPPNHVTPSDHLDSLTTT